MRVDIDLTPASEALSTVVVTGTLREQFVSESPVKVEVVTARDGPDALAKAVAVRPDLVLLDVQMPGIDGYTICSRIRADASLAAVPVVIVTANYGSTEVEAARRAGADDFLVKPFLPATLVDLAKAMLS